MNRYSKIEYPNESSGGGGSNFSLPSFTNALGQTMSNMKSMQDFNEKMIDRQVQGLEEAGKLQTGLFSAIGGLNTYLSQYSGDKEHVDNVVKQYYTQLEDISKNPNDPYIKLKISDLGRKITADMTMGDLSKVISNAKIHAERTKDLEQNKGLIAKDSGMIADYDIQNRGFKGTFSRDKDGKVSYNSLKYAPVSPMLDIDTDLAEYMKSLKPNTVLDKEPFSYVTLENDPHGGYVVSKKIKGVGESVAHERIKDFFMTKVNDPNDEYKRRLIRDFNVEANGKDYIERKGPDGKKTKLSLEEYIDATINKEAELRRGRFVNIDEDVNVHRHDRIAEFNKAKKDQSDLLTEQLQRANIGDQIYDRKWDRNFKEDNEKWNRELELAKLQLAKSKADAAASGGKKSINGVGINWLNPDNSSTPILETGSVEKSKTGLDMIKHDALRRVSNNENDPIYDDYKAVGDKFDDFITNNRRSVSKYAPDAKLLKLNVPEVAKNTIAQEYALLMSDRSFREASTDNKISMLRKAVESKTGTSISKSVQSWRDVFVQVKDTPIYQLDGKAVTGDEFYRGYVNQNLNRGVHNPTYYLAEDNKDMISYYKKVSDSIIANNKLKEGAKQIDIGRDLDLSKEEFDKIMTSTHTKFTPNIRTNTLTIDAEIPYMEDKVKKYKNRTFTVHDEKLVREFSDVNGRAAYKATEVIPGRGGDASHLKGPVDARLTQDEIVRKNKFISSDNTQFVLNIGEEQVSFVPSNSKVFHDKKELENLRNKFKLDLKDRFVLVSDTKTGDVIDVYEYSNKTDKESNFNDLCYNYLKLRK